MGKAFAIRRPAATAPHGTQPKAAMASGKKCAKIHALPAMLLSNSGVTLGEVKGVPCLQALSGQPMSCIASNPWIRLMVTTPPLSLIRPAITDGPHNVGIWKCQGLRKVSVSGYLK